MTPEMMSIFIACMMLVCLTWNTIHHVTVHRNTADASRMKTFIKIVILNLLILYVGGMSLSYI